MIDSTTIDTDTFSRSVTSMLPTGSTWAASGNRFVAELLGFGSCTQAVMYGGSARDHFYWGLSADDVNMVRMARTGVDLQSGTTDDYTEDLVFVGDCTNPHEVRVALASLGQGVLGGCDALVDYSFPPGNPFLARHYSVIPAATQTDATVFINSDVPWQFELPLFYSGFECGDTSEWHDITP